jgi:biopolymer transport protein TolR
MVATPMLKKENALQVELPKGNVKETSDTQKQELIVQIDKSGKLSLNNAVVKEVDLISQLKKQVNPKQQKTVFVKADTGVSYGKVIELVDKIKHVGGIKYVALATTKTVT